MKRFLLGLALGLLLPANAFGIEFETIRTKENPGFFLVKVFSDDSMRPFVNVPVFINGVGKDETAQYQNILTHLEENGHRVITEDQLKTSTFQQGTRFVMIGQDSKDYLSFTTDKADNSLETFNQFREEALAPVFLRNIELKFGGNITEVLKEGHTLTTNNAINIIGKFKNPMKTYLEITGETPYGLEKYSAFIALDDKTKANDPLAEHLPELWEDLKQQSKEVFPRSWDAPVFPILLFVVGLFIILWVVREAYTKRSEEKKSAEKIINNMPKNVKSGINKDEIPFEIVFKDEDEGPKKKK